MKDTLETLEKQVYDALQLNTEEVKAIEKEGQTIEELCEDARLNVKQKVKKVLENAGIIESDEIAESFSQIAKKSFLQQEYEIAETLEKCKNL